MQVIPRSRLRVGLSSVLFAVCVLAVSSARAQQLPGSQAEASSAVLVVNIRAGDGGRSDVQAIIRLFDESGTTTAVGSPVSGRMAFSGLAPGRYSIEVVAPGYQKLNQPVDIALAGQHEQLSITLIPESANAESAPPTATPILAPNAQNELDKALEALRAGKNDEAKHHLEKVSRSAPSDPNLNYLWGAYYAQVKDIPKAKEYWQKTIEIDPRNAFALAALAQLATGAGNFPAAIGYLERATNADPSSWLYQERLAVAYMDQDQMDQAEKHAVRATEIGKEHAGDAQLILAQVLLKRNERDRAIKALEAFLAAEPESPKVPQARALIESLRTPVPTAVSPAPSTDSQPATPPSAAAAPAKDGNASPVLADLLPKAQWFASDVDDSVPPIEPGVSCPLSKIQQETGERVRGFINAVNRVSATEYLDNDVVDATGLPKRHETRRYSYVVAVSRLSQGMVDFQEYRNGSMGFDDFPERIASLGLPALVLVFDPTFRDDYDVSCEGLSRWHDRLAWQVHFRQRQDKPARLSGYRVNNNFYAVPLRGRAWIATDTFQVVSLETDIVAPIPEIRLKAEHTFIEYAPVKFTKSSQALWLPESAELYFDFRGRRMHRRHYFRNYMLFSVDEHQQIADPKASVESDAIPPAQ